MVKLTAPVREVARMLDLVPFLDSHPFISIKELASEFGTTQDEMRNSLISLSMCGAPGMTPYDMIEVNYETDFVTINQHEDLNTIRALTNEEVLVTALGLALLKDRIEPQRTDLLYEIEEVQDQLSEVLGNHVVTSHNPDSEISILLQRAIKGRSSIDIRYKSDTVRRVIPLTIEFRNGLGYCTVYSESVQDFRLLRLDAIEYVGEGDSHQRQLSPSLDSHPSLRARILIHHSLRRYRELFSISEISSDRVGVLEAFSSDWLIRSIVSAGGAVEMLEQTFIRSEIATRAQEILALYRD